jgi:hypothetical protein
MRITLIDSHLNGDASKAVFLGRLSEGNTSVCRFLSQELSSSPCEDVEVYLRASRKGYSVITMRLNEKTALRLLGGIFMIEEPVFDDLPMLSSQWY